MATYFFYNVISNLFIRIFCDKVFILFTKNIIKCFFFRCTTIEGSLNWYTVVVIIFLIIRINHQLCDVKKSSESFILKTSICSIELSFHTFVIIRFLYFDKSKWESVDKTSYVWTKIIFCIFIFTYKLSCYMPCVIFRIIKIN